MERKKQIFTLCYEEKKLKEWTSLRDNIKLLRSELATTSASLEEKMELEKDIQCLLTRKNNCAKLLGMDI
jgi:Tfp pilus assembly protein PilN